MSARDSDMHLRKPCIFKSGLAELTYTIPPVGISGASNVERLSSPIDFPSTTKVSNPSIFLSKTKVNVRLIFRSTPKGDSIFPL